MATFPKQPFKLSHRFARKQTTSLSVKLATLQWVHWFDHTRLLKRIGDIPPAEAEANYRWQLASQEAQPA